MKRTLLILMCVLFFLSPIIGAVEETPYTLRIMSEKQVKAGGRPEYTVTNQDGEKITVVVSTVEGTVVRLPKGTYTVKEVKTTEGFVPQNGGEIEITLPHKNELGEEFNTCILGMKSELKKNPVEFLTYEKDPEKKKEPEKKEEKKEEKKDEGGPSILGKRFDPERRPEEKPQEKPQEKPEETPEKAPQTGDINALSEGMILLAGLAMFFAFMFVLVKLDRKEKRSREAK